MPIVDVFDAGLLSEPGGSEAILQAPVGALGRFAVDEESERFFEAQCIEVGHVQLLDERPVHTGELQFEQLVEDRMGDYMHW